MKIYCYFCDYFLHKTQNVENIIHSERAICTDSGHHHDTEAFFRKPERKCAIDAGGNIDIAYHLDF